MDAQARAGIDIHGSELRYTEVERYGSRRRLLRLGSCDFDFDVAREVLYVDGSPHLEVISDALRDVFAGSAASTLFVTLPPTGCYSFFTSLQTGLTSEERNERFQQEVALLAGSDTSRAIRTTADALYTELLPDGRNVEWFHVLGVEENVYKRFDLVMAALPQVNYRIRVSMQGAASVLAHTEEALKGAGRNHGLYVLAIGMYASHIEYTLFYNGKWYFSRHSAATTPADCAYYSVATLKRVGLTPADVEHVYLYGIRYGDEDLSILQAIFHKEPEWLNPIQVVDLDPDSLASGFDAEAYVPCIGAVLD